MLKRLYKPSPYSPKLIVHLLVFYQKNCLTNIENYAIIKTQRPNG